MSSSHSPQLWIDSNSKPCEFSDSSNASSLNVCVQKKQSFEVRGTPMLKRPDSQFLYFSSVARVKTKQPVRSSTFLTLPNYYSR